MKGPRSAIPDLLLISVMTVWGLNFSVIKLIYEHFDPIAFNALRFSVSAITMYLILRLSGHPLDIEPRDRWTIFLLGLLANTMYQFLFVLGMARSRAGNAGLLMALTPVFAYLAGLILKREGYSSKVSAGIVLSFAGVVGVILFGSGNFSVGATWKGDLMILGASFCWGSYTAISPRMLSKYGALRLSVSTMLAGTLVLVPLSLPRVVAQDWSSIPARGWVAFSYAAFLAIVFASLVWTYALSRLGVSRTAIYANLTPVVGLFGAWLILDEAPAAAQIAGVLLVLTGVYIVRSHKPISSILPEE